MITVKGCDGLSYQIGLNPDKSGEIEIWQSEPYGFDLQYERILVIDVLKLFPLEYDDRQAIKANPDSPLSPKVSWLDASPA